jgi:hypothetical protein
MSGVDKETRPKRAARKPPPYLVVFARADGIIFGDNYLASVILFVLILSRPSLISSAPPPHVSPLLSFSLSSLCSAMHSFTTLLLALSVPLHALAAHSPLRRHDALAHRARGDLLPRQSYDNVRITFYEIDVGTYACLSAINLPS